MKLSNGSCNFKVGVLDVCPVLKSCYLITTARKESHASHYGNGTVMMDLDLDQEPIHRQQAWMIHSVSTNKTMPCIIDYTVVINGYYNLRGRGGGAFTLHQEQKFLLAVVSHQMTD